MLRILASLLVFASWPIAAQAAGPKPVTATVLHPESEWGAGDIEITFDNGKKKTLTHGGRCARPKISAHGDIGWSVWLDANDDPKYQHSGELLRVRLHDGTTVDFHPNSLYIKDWNFAANDSAVIIDSMGHHGHQFYIEYDIKTGQILDHVDEYKPYAELPSWAQPIATNQP